MSMYTWAWSDEESTYINKADSLFEIVETIIDYYYGDTDEEEKHYNITELNGRGCTEFCVNGLMAGNRRTSRTGYDLKHKESSTQRSHR
jgi:hypothetical protein